MMPPRDIPHHGFQGTPSEYSQFVLSLSAGLTTKPSEVLDANLWLNSWNFYYIDHLKRYFFPVIVNPAGGTPEIVLNYLDKQNRVREIERHPLGKIEREFVSQNSRRTKTKTLKFILDCRQQVSTDDVNSSAGTAPEQIVDMRESLEN
jgi:hypothetical protein